MSLKFEELIEEHPDRKRLDTIKLKNVFRGFMLRWLEELVYRQSGTYVKNLLTNKYPVVAYQPSSSPQHVTMPAASALYTIFSIEIRIATTSMPIARLGKVVAVPASNRACLVNS
jgi:hypothetical protein